MIPKLLPLVLLACAWSLQAEDSPYQTQLRRLQDNVLKLEVVRHDFKKEKPGLPPAEEAEYLRLSSQLRDLDPIGVLLKELEQNILALIEIKDPTPADVALLDEQKGYMAITASLTSEPESLEQARSLATAARQFILRKDMAGLLELSRPKR
jgi:hypothetical protein